MKKSMKWAAAAALACGLAGANASAATWYATGTINNFAFDNSSGLLENAAVGKAFTFEFSFNEAVASNGLGLYARPYTAKLTVADSTFDYSWDSSGNVPSLVTNFGGADSYTVSANDARASGGLSLTELVGGPLSSTALPTLAQANAFDGKFFTFLIAGNSPFAFDAFTGTVSNISAVPLPAAAWLLLSGLTGVAAFARRRRRDDLPVGVAA